MTHSAASSPHRLGYARTNRGVSVHPPLSSDRAESFAASWRVFQSTKIYDVLCAAPLIIWYGLSAGRLLPALFAKLEDADVHAIDIAFVLSVLAQTVGIALIGLALVFLLLRRPAVGMAKVALPCIAAVVGTLLGSAGVWVASRPMGMR